MAHILELKEVQRIIIAVARNFTIPGNDFDDIVQIGRIAVWQLLKRYNFDEKSILNHPNLIYTCVKRALLNEVRSQKTKKTSPLNNAYSLDDEKYGKLGRQVTVKENNAIQALISKEEKKIVLQKYAKKSLEERTPSSKRMVIRLLVDMLDLSEKEIPKGISCQTFIDAGLYWWLWVFFGHSPYKAIRFAYPQFYYHQMPILPRNSWPNNKNGKNKAVKYLKMVLEESGYEEAYYPKLLTKKFFEEYKLIVPLRYIFKNDRFKFLDAAFPGAYHPWEFSKSPARFFNSMRNIKKAVRWMVEEKLGFDMKHLSVHDVWDKKIAYKITVRTFRLYGLEKIIDLYPSPESILRLVYPKKFLPWSFRNIGKWQQGENSKKLAKDATRWLIEKHLKISPNSSEVNHGLLVRHGLQGMVTSRNLGMTSYKKVMQNAYPELKF